MEPQPNVSIEVIVFLNYDQNSEGGLNAAMTPNNIKFDTE